MFVILFLFPEVMWSDFKFPRMPYMFWSQCSDEERWRVVEMVIEDSSSL